MQMNKALTIFGALLLLAGCAKPEADFTPAVPEGGPVSFVASFDGTRVTTADGVNSWEAGDQISVFSCEEGAAAGVSVGTNVTYAAAASGPTSSFEPVGMSVAAAKKYHAVYPYSPEYPSNLNAAEATGFAGAKAADPVTDYRFVPIAVNSGVTFQVDPETGEAKALNAAQYFWATADAPATQGDPVTFTFTPVLPLLEFDLYGYGTVRQIVVSFTDKDTDSYASDNWLTAKGVVDLSSGQFTTTNYSTSAFFKINVTLKESDEKPYADLLGDKPVKLKITVGNFTVTKGLTLTFTDKDGAQFIKTIWAGSTVTTKGRAGKVKHILQGIDVPYVKASVASLAEFESAGGVSEAFTVSSTSAWSVKSKPDWISLSAGSGTPGASVTAAAAANKGAARTGEIAFQNAEGNVCRVSVSQAEYVVTAAEWYSVDLGSVDFSASYIHDVTDATSAVIARITKEFLGATVNKQAVVVYPAPTATPYYTRGLVAEVTYENGAAASGNINGGSVSSDTMTPGDVVYTPGTSARLTTVYVKADGSEIVTANPGGSVSAGGVSPFQLASPSGINHALVKIGNRIWTAEGYKTRKLQDGTDLNVVGATGGTSSTVATVAVDGDMYLYNASAMKAGIAPSGWRAPTVAEWKTNLAAFLGGTSTYANMSATGAQLFSRNCFKKPNANAPSDLGYYNTWSNAANGEKWDMLLAKSGAAPSNSAQAMTAMFEVRLIKE